MFFAAMWSIFNIVSIILAPVANPVFRSLEPGPLTTRDDPVIRETYFQIFITLFLHARLPYVLVVAKMEKLWRTEGSTALIQKTLVETSFNHGWDAERNPEGLLHGPSEFQTRWNACMDEIGQVYELSSCGTAALLGVVVALLGGYDGYQFFAKADYTPGDTSPALFWCRFLSISSAAWATIYHIAFKRNCHALKGAHIGASWEIYTDGDRKTDFWWNWPLALAAPGIYVYWSITLRIMLLLVSMSQPAHPDPNSSRTFEIIFKLSFMIFNVVAFAQFVGTMRFWGAMGEVHEYWQNELKIPGRREQWAKDIEKCISPQGDAPVLGCSAIPSGPSGPDMAGPTVADSTTACCDEAISQLSAPSEG